MVGVKLPHKEDVIVQHQEAPSLSDWWNIINCNFSSGTNCAPIQEKDSLSVLFCPGTFTLCSKGEWIDRKNLNY